MTVRTFGVVQAAGTRVVERGAPRQARSAPYGTTLSVGWYRSGPTDRAVILRTGEPQYRRIFGGLHRGSEAPLGSEHWYRKAEGRGLQIVQRVTDGTDEQAELPLWTRDAARFLLEASPSIVRNQVGTLKAHNGGRWGGRKDAACGAVTLPTALATSTTINLGLASGLYPDGKWEGATLLLEQDPTHSYVITAYDGTTGIATIQGTWSAIALAYSGTSGWTLELGNADDVLRLDEELGIRLTDGGEGNVAAFGIEVSRNGAPVSAYPNVQLSPTGDAYWSKALEDDGANYELAPADVFAGDPADPYSRPANYAEVPAPGGVTATTLTFQTVRWNRVAAASGNPYLDTVNDWTAPTACPWRELAVLCTFTSGTAFNVSLVTPTGESFGIGAGTLGSSFALGPDWAPTFTLRDGGTAPTAGDTLTIYWRPLPSDLSDRGAWLYVAAGPDDGDVRERYRVISNTLSRVTVQDGADLTAVCQALEAPEDAAVSAGPYDLSAGSLTFIYSVGGRGPYTLTTSLSGGAETAADLADDLNALELTRAGAAADKLIEFSDDGGTLAWVALQDYGSSASIVLGNGTMNTELGVSNGRTANGPIPTISRLEWSEPMHGGTDGLAGLAAGDVQAPFLAVSGYLRDVVAADVGLISLMIPGWTDGDVVATAATWAYQSNAHYWPEVPDNVTDEAAAIAWHEANVAIGPAQDYAPTLFPAYGKIRNPYGAGLYTASMVGATLGLLAREAVDRKGYQDAPAGRDWSLADVFKDLTTEDRVLDAEALNGYGLIEVRKRGAELYLWGDRIPGQYGRLFLHKRRMIQHVSRTLLFVGDLLTFSRINEATFARARRLLRGLFTPWYQAGWFDDVDGPGFGDQVSITVDASNNPASERAAGRLNAAIAFTPVGTAEQVVIEHGPRGITERDG